MTENPALRQMLLQDDWDCIYYIHILQSCIRSSIFGGGRHSEQKSFYWTSQGCDGTMYPTLILLAWQMFGQSRVHCMRMLAAGLCPPQFGNSCVFDIRLKLVSWLKSFLNSQQPCTRIWSAAASSSESPQKIATCLMVRISWHAYRHSLHTLDGAHH